MRGRRIILDSKGHHPRGGIVLVMILACLAVITLLLAGLLDRSMDNGRQVRYETWRVQAEWMAESGLQRAAFRLEQDPDYRGETWTLTEADGLTRPADVTITVASIPGGHRIETRVVLGAETGRQVQSKAHTTVVD